VDKEDLFKPLLLEEEFEILGRGKVTIRPLTREELHRVRHQDTGAGERETLAACIVDPKLTVGEVRLWQEAAPAGELTPLIARIMEISGLGKGAGKSDLSGVPE
jgi:hypothetical protein